VVTAGAWLAIRPPLLPDIAQTIKTTAKRTITAGTTHAVRVAFDSVPDADALAQCIDSIPGDMWFDDPNGKPDHRRHLAKHFAEEIRRELA